MSARRTPRRTQDPLHAQCDSTESWGRAQVEHGPAAAMAAASETAEMSLGEVPERGRNRGGPALACTAAFLLQVRWRHGQGMRHEHLRTVVACCCAHTRRCAQHTALTRRGLCGDRLVVRGAQVRDALEAARARVVELEALLKIKEEEAAARDKVNLCS